MRPRPRQRVVPAFRLELPINPRWGSIDVMHRTIVNCVESILADGALSGTIGMIASELIENAVKYADWSQPGRAAILVRPRPAKGGDVIEIEVRSPLAREEDYEELQGVLAWIRSYPSPREAFLARLRELAEGRAGPRCRLGLCRVSFEGGCAIEARLSEPGGIVHVRATVPCSLSAPYDRGAAIQSPA